MVRHRRGGGVERGFESIIEKNQEWVVGWWNRALKRIGGRGSNYGKDRTTRVK